ncbi:MAG: MSCRAMM family protein, partial [Candidatus Geothermincolia bacterium]
KVEEPLVEEVVVADVPLVQQENGVSDENKEVTSLDISKDVDSVAAGGPLITLEKTASTGLINMLVGDSAPVTFTILVTAMESDSFTIAGNIFVQNTGEWPALVTDVSDTVWYKAGGPAWLPAGSSITTTVPAVIPTGDHVYSYSGSFTLPVPLADVTSMSNFIEITISNHAPPPGEPNTFKYRQDFAKPVAGNGLGIESLSDVETIAPMPGLSYTVDSVTINGSAASLTGPWDLDLNEAPFTIVIAKTLTATAAGVYVLNNQAFLGDLMDEVDVDIIVDEEVTEEGNGAIAGTKFLDADGDGVLDAGELPLAGVIINLSGDATDQRVTGSDGMYSFTNLEPGNYTVAEVVPAGYYATSAVSQAVVLDPDETEVVDFLNAPFGAIIGTKILDLDGDGELDAGEDGLAGVTIRLRDGEGNIIAEMVTGADGMYAFNGLEAGDYSVEEVVPAGFQATSPVSSGVMALVPGANLIVNFFNEEIPEPIVPLGPPVVPLVPEEVAPEQVAPEEQAPQELPRTGLELTFFLVSALLVIMGGLMLTGLGLAKRRS